MKRILLFISLALASLQAFAQPAIADTTRVSLFDRGNKWSASLLDLKTYVGASGGSVATDAIWDAAGDIVQGTGANTAARLAIGTANQQLRVNAGATALEYFTPSGGSGDVATDAIWDAKGDLAVGTGANTAARLPVGTNGQPLYADAAASTGLRWGELRVNPAQITTDQDDYTPAGWAKANVVRIEADGSMPHITSFGASYAGDRKTLVNTGAFPWSIACEHPDGTAANRVAGAGVYIVYPNESIDLWADSTSNRWRVLGQNSRNDQLPGVFYRWSAASIAAADWGDIGFVTSGTGAAVGAGAPVADVPAYALLGTGTTAIGTAAAYFAKSTIGFSRYRDAQICATFYSQLPTLSDGTNRYTAYWELSSTVSTAAFANNSIGIRYTDNVVTGNFQLYSRSNAGVETTVDTAIPVVAATRYLMRIELNEPCTEALFYINGVYAGRVSANMPNTGQVGCRASIIKSVGTTGSALRLHSMTAAAYYPN